MENGPFIDGLPNLNMGGSFRGYVTNNQMDPDGSSFIATNPTVKYV